ncbi:MAG: T9SS type B sorting domain-containing protein [Jejuia sp.]
MKKIALIVFLWMIGLESYSQRQAANWYFGNNAGITFNPNNSVTSGTQSNIKTFEGCASISDDDGNTLFYTDGINIWNKFNDIMQNGTGLKGDPSSSQSALIVPKPKSNSIYYVFTVDDIVTNADPVNRGLNYSIVDMSLNGGAGAVTQKNVNLIPQCSEKVTAVSKGCDDENIWIISFGPETTGDFNFNTFYAFQINERVINTIPVKSTFTNPITDGRGYLKLSPDGKKMAAAHTSNGVFLYDFDVNTGKVTNEQILTKLDLTPSPYGVEFSPNNRFLYVNYSNDYFGQDSNNPSTHSASLIQFDLLAPDIELSLTEIDNRQLFRGALQLGPDGKIYRALSETYENGLPYLGVIQSPNNKGIACNYNHQGVSLAPFLSGQGLPPFITSYFNSKIDIIQNGKDGSNLAICENDSFTLRSVDILGANYVWTKDGNTLANTSFDLTVSEEGHYEVFIEPNNGECPIEGEAFVTVNTNPQAFNYTIFQCDEDGVKDGITLFNLEEANQNLTNGAPNLGTRFYSDALKQIPIINTTNYMNSLPNEIIYVEVYNTQTSCKADATLTLNVSVTDANNTSIEVCDDDGLNDGITTFDLSSAYNQIISGLLPNLEVTFYESYEDALLEQNIVDNNYTNIVGYNQLIFARVENDNNCYGISEVQLIVNQLPVTKEQEDVFYCSNWFPQTAKIDAGLENEAFISKYDFVWNTGETTYDIDINQAGRYTVSITDKITGCGTDNSITVLPSGIATFDIPNSNINDGSVNNRVEILATGSGQYQYALYDEANMVSKIPYQDSPIFENVSPGIYTVRVRDVQNDCGVINDKIAVVGFPKFLTPNDDGHNDTWQVYGVSKMFNPNTKIKIFNRFGKLIKEISPLSDGWNGTSNGQLLPSDDYWFSVLLEDGRTFRDHFTLKY